MAHGRFENIWQIFIGKTPTQRTQTKDLCYVIMIQWILLTAVLLFLLMSQKSIFSFLPSVIDFLILFLSEIKKWNRKYKTIIIPDL